MQGVVAEKCNRPSRRARFAFFVAQAPMHFSTRSTLLKNATGKSSGELLELLPNFFQNFIRDFSVLLEEGAGGVVAAAEIHVAEFV
jgi:hypothetical protein